MEKQNCKEQCFSLKIMSFLKTNDNVGIIHLVRTQNIPKKSIISYTITFPIPYQEVRNVTFPDKCV